VLGLHSQGVEGQIFSPMARTYAYALAGALLGTFTVTPVLSSLLLPEQVQEVETIVVRGVPRVNVKKPSLSEKLLFY